MDVIVGSKPRFRVNATPTTRPEAPKNYGSVDEFVTLPSATAARAICQAAPRPSFAL
ncbi:hypothetical protein SAMN05443247_08959 [Bradyrhizobium erythrophlei]|nr:hypothetical protein SAMN05443247_08959 [Bradyrhizobium erythrophlei]